MSNKYCILAFCRRSIDGIQKKIRAVLEEQAYKLLMEKRDAINYWRTKEGYEVDFIRPSAKSQNAVFIAH